MVDNSREKLTNLLMDLEFSVSIPEFYRPFIKSMNTTILSRFSYKSRQRIIYIGANSGMDTHVQFIDYISIDINDGFDPRDRDDYTQMLDNIMDALCNAITSNSKIMNALEHITYGNYEIVMLYDNESQKICVNSVNGPD